MENNNEKIRYQLAAERVVKIRKFYMSLAMFFIVFMILCGSRFLQYGFPNWTNLQFSAIFAVWALILAVRGAKLFFFNTDWEKDMINKELKKQDHGNYK